MTFDDFTEFKVQRYSMWSIILGRSNHRARLNPDHHCLWHSVFWFLAVKPKTTFKKQVKRITFPTFIALWFLIIGFLPGYFIQSKTQIYEQFIWNASGDQKLPGFRK